MLYEFYMKIPPPKRPQEPEGLALTDDFIPDQSGIGAWAKENFIDENGPLHNPRHSHLQFASIGWLWTSATAKTKGRSIAGQCRLAPPDQNTWSSAMAHFQLREWFGATPDFIIIISRWHALDSDDWAFCALIEHELCHAAQAKDEFGQPRFNQEGHPMFEIAGHDVEQFHDVVERYGAVASGVDKLARLANKGPIFGEAKVQLACGTCKLRAVA